MVHVSYLNELIQGDLKCKASEDVISHLESWGHENRTTHEDKDHESSDSLLPDAQKLGLLSWSGATRLHLQAVNVGDGEDGCSHEPRQAHDGAHTQHNCHYQQVQVIATAFLLDTPGDKRQQVSLRARRRGEFVPAGQMYSLSKNRITENKIQEYNLYII